MTEKEYSTDPGTETTETMATKLLSESEVEAALDTERALSVVEQTYVEINRGRVLNPAKLSMHMGDDGEWPN